MVGINSKIGFQTYLFTDRISKSIFCLSSLFLVSCSTTGPRQRLLTSEEIQKYNLNGILHEAEICPNKFDEQLKRLVVVGPCEKIDCDVVDGQTVCRAKK